MRPLDVAILDVDVNAIRRAFGLSVKRHGEAPEAIAQYLVSGNMDGGNFRDVYVEVLGYLMIAKHPCRRVGLIVYYVEDASAREHNLLILADGITGDRGGSGCGIHVGYLRGTNIIFALATRGKGEGNGYGYKSRKPQ